MEVARELAEVDRRARLASLKSQPQIERQIKAHTYSAVVQQKDKTNTTWPIVIGIKQCERDALLSICRSMGIERPKFGKPSERWAVGALCRAIAQGKIKCVQVSDIDMSA